MKVEASDLFQVSQLTSDVAARCAGRHLAVTGGGGFIGAHLVHALVRAGAQVRVLEGPPDGAAHPLPVSARVYRGEIRDVPLLMSVFEGAEGVIHLAGPASVASSFDHPQLTSDLHTGGTLAVLDACRRQGVERLVYVSSAEVYGRSPVQPVKETFLPAARSPYAAAKLAAEQHIHAWVHAYAKQAVVVRPFSVYGPGAAPTSLMARILSQVQHAGAVELLDLKPVRDYCFIADLVDALVRASLLPLPDWSVFNIGSGEGHSVEAVAHFACSVAGRKMPVRQVQGPTRPGESDIFSLVADISSAQEYLHWRPRTSLLEGMRLWLSLLTKGCPEGADASTTSSPIPQATLGLASPTGAPLIQLNSLRQKCFLGLDIGGSKLLACVVDASGKVRHQIRRSTGRATPPATALPLLIDVCHELKDWVARALDQAVVSGVGVGFPGLVDMSAGIVRSSVMLDGWQEYPLAAELSRMLELPTIVDNDVNVAALAEATFWPDGGQDGLLFVAVGTGIGGALVLNRQVWRGFSGVAGEIGNTTIDLHGPTCWCGRRGCLNVYAAGEVMASISPEASAGAPSRFPPLAPSLAEAAHRLGIGIGNALQLLNPARVILGGGIALSTPAFLPAVAATARAECFAEAAGCEFAVARSGYEAGALGAALLARREARCWGNLSPSPSP